MIGEWGAWVQEAAALERAVWTQKWGVRTLPADGLRRGGLALGGRRNGYNVPTLSSCLSFPLPSLEHLPLQPFFPPPLPLSSTLLSSSSWPLTHSSSACWTPTRQVFLLPLSQPSVGLSLSALLLSLSRFLCCWFSFRLCVLLSLGGSPLRFSSSLFSSLVSAVHLLSDSVIPVQRCVRVGEAVACTLGVGVLICCTTASSREAWWAGVVGGGLS